MGQKAKKIIVVSTLLMASLVARAQQGALLEACNAIDDRAKRLACMQELTSIKGSGSSDAAEALRRVKDAFAGIAGAVNAGVSFNNYRSMIVDPARALGVFKQQNPNASKEALDSLDASVAAYNDAERLWRASIYESQDAGILFGQILNYEQSGLTDVVKKYGLPTTTVLMNPHVSANQALPIIWRYADQTAQSAFTLL